MSRIGKEPVVLSNDVKVKIEDCLCIVEGAKGKLEFPIHDGITVKVENNTVLVKRRDDSKILRSLHGTSRAIINNMVKGVTEGFKKELEIIGVGYKAQLKGNKLVLNIGFSHQVEMGIPEGLKVSTPSVTRISIEGVDKQKVGEFAAKVRKRKPPEPYKGKGIRYVGEEVRKKLGKALAK